ncbi:MAG: hypothetical protein KatS3mg035_2106 [Bacteroidia bacterium]|nr:MAG: hypothetical protein KatS3mg035_2106 [Bacteroidia bacterium]
MNFFAWLIFGIFVGFVAHILDSRSMWSGLFGALLFGVAGALTGGFLAMYIFEISFMKFNILGFMLAFGGALFSVLLQRTVLGRGERF